MCFSFRKNFHIKHSKLKFRSVYFIWNNVSSFYLSRHFGIDFLSDMRMKMVVCLSDLEYILIIETDFLVDWVELTTLFKVSWKQLNHVLCLLTITYTSMMMCSHNTQLYEGKSTDPHPLKLSGPPLILMLIIIKQI